MNIGLSPTFFLAAFDIQVIRWLSGILTLIGIVAIALLALATFTLKWQVRRTKSKLENYLSTLDQWRVEPEGKSLKDFPFFSAILNEAIPDYNPSPMGFCRGDIQRWTFYYYYLGQSLAPNFSNCVIIVSSSDNFTGSLRLRHEGKFPNQINPRHLHNFLRVDFILNDKDVQGWHVLDQNGLDKKLLAEVMPLLQMTQCVREVVLSGPYVCCMSHPGTCRHHELEELRNTNLDIEELLAVHRTKQQA